MFVKYVKLHDVTKEMIIGWEGYIAEWKKQDEARKLYEERKKRKMSTKLKGDKAHKALALLSDTGAGSFHNLPKIQHDKTPRAASKRKMKT